MPRPSPFERARAYIQRSAPKAIQGSNGDDTTYAVACALVIEFALSDDEAWPLLEEYNRTKCLPQWNERDLAAKLRSARNMARSKPNEVGRLLREDRDGYTGASGGSAANHAAPARGSAPKRPQTGPPKAAPPQSRTVRTARTPLFTVQKAGTGAEPRTVRTLRTLVFNSLAKTPTATPINTNSEKPSEVSEVKKGPESKAVALEPVKPAQNKPAGEVAGLLFNEVFPSVEAWVKESAKRAGGPVTISLKSTGRLVTVFPNGKRLLMGEMKGDDEPTGETGTERP